MIVVPIVEGDGEVQAVRVLLTRLSMALTPHRFVEIAKPIRVRRDRFLNRDDEFERMLRLAHEKCDADGAILILLDADDDCPAQLGPALLAKARAFARTRAISVVLANREFEAWFIASAEALDGERGLRIADADVPADPDRIRGAKEWLSRRIANGRYRETTDQPALASRVDVQLARRRSRSFRKLCADWEALVS
jgi:hypothetical protein